MKNTQKKIMLDFLLCYLTARIISNDTHGYIKKKNIKKCFKKKKTKKKMLLKNIYMIIFSQTHEVDRTTLLASCLYRSLKNVIKKKKFI